MTFKIFKKITNDLVKSNEIEKMQILTKIYSNEQVMKNSFKNKKEMIEVFNPIVELYTNKMDKMNVKNWHDLFDFMIQVKPIVNIENLLKKSLEKMETSDFEI
jgi:hypothetical protein